MGVRGSKKSRSRTTSWLRRRMESEEAEQEAGAVVVKEVVCEGPALGRHWAGEVARRSCPDVGSWVRGVGDGCGPSAAPNLYKPVFYP